MVGVIWCCFSYCMLSIQCSLQMHCRIANHLIIHIWIILIRSDYTHSHCQIFTNTKIEWHTHAFIFRLHSLIQIGIHLFSFITWFIHLIHYQWKKLLSNLLFSEFGPFDWKVMWCISCVFSLKPINNMRPSTSESLPFMFDMSKDIRLLHVVTQTHTHSHSGTKGDKLHTWQTAHISHWILSIIIIAAATATIIRL